ncbi:non-canonical purine NTP pyrophosphatase, RdgB/HAM1 family [Sphingorhabdus lutea]|uniref:dITP/XTP pyrophosphatase n=1 Tax=Sphingorhabdus lutea TaxID=1913578 RepID=A0A1L3JBH0_9SPHN|nr:RdgB/HAM1 family non-canonical purine NTP pyrophosphatase [Sphingorhabdus lutea]APG62466.1 non-canonical purine NTP pyrophosphatase, RdgB/HAM1 family [Sphingorhabdus lutea]
MNKKLSAGKLVIASHNQGKVREIRALLAPYGIEPISAAELNLPEPEETGTTFAENALIKAHSAAKGANMVALADDSGLCVTSLGGAPGVYTADWAEEEFFHAGKRTTDGSRNWYLAMGKVEGRLAQLGMDVDRSAFFTCTLALAWPDGSERVFEGRVNGSLTWPPRGDKGFGYDPVFVANGMDKTFGEIDPDAKHAISHRADAFAKFIADMF